MNENLKTKLLEIKSIYHANRMRDFFLKLSRRMIVKDKDFTSDVFNLV